MKQTIKKWLQDVSTHRYHHSYKVRAQEVLRNIESVQGKTDPDFIRLSDEYAKDVLGWQGYAPWLYVYSAVRGEFKEGWIPDNYYGKVVVPALCGNYGTISDLNTLTHKLFQSDCFPDLAYYANGIFFTKEYTVLGDGQIKAFLFRNSDKIVYKLDGSSQGKSIFFLDRTSFDLDKIRALGNGVFQDYIDQHPFFQQIMPSSVATLRITTVFDTNGDFSARTCYLRVGRRDDTHMKATSNIRISVDLKSGELDSKGYLPSWLSVEEHPDTHVAFAHTHIPNFDQCVSTVLDLHRHIPSVRCIGWDTIVDANNRVQIIEWNGEHSDIKFAEARQGPCFVGLGWERMWQNV